MTKKACDRCGSEMKSRMTRRSNRLLDGGKVHRSNTSVWWPAPWYTVYDRLLPRPLFSSPSNPSLLPLFSALFVSLCFMQRPTCPEGIDFQDGFDPVVMILSFASATSFSRLQSPLNMLQIRPEERMEGEERSGGGSEGCCHRGHLMLPCRGEA